MMSQKVMAVKNLLVLGFRISVQSRLVRSEILL